MSTLKYSPVQIGTDTDWIKVATAAQNGFLMK